MSPTVGSRQRLAPTAGAASGRTPTETGGLPQQVFPRTSGENDHRIYEGAAAEELWDALPSVASARRCRLSWYSRPSFAVVWVPDAPR